VAPSGEQDEGDCAREQTDDDERGWIDELAADRRPREQLIGGEAAQRQGGEEEEGRLQNVDL
jgi:hypothetical protein